MRQRFSHPYLVALSVIVVCLIGWLLYISHHTDPLSSRTTKTSSQTKANTISTPSLLGYNLPNEKLNLNYPSTWQVGNINSPNSSTTVVKPGTDNIELVSPTNLLVTINTGVTNPTISFNNILASTPINTLGGNYYLVFYSSHAQSAGLAQGACVVGSPNGNISFPNSRNITAASINPVNLICLSYPQDENGEAFENTVAAFQNDASYKSALNIIRSISY